METIGGKGKSQMVLGIEEFYAGLFVVALEKTMGYMDFDVHIIESV